MISQRMFEINSQLRKEAKVWLSQQNELQRQRELKVRKQIIMHVPKSDGPEIPF